MIDLTKKGLPNVVEIGGNPYSIYTDFRLWMKFEIAVSKIRAGERIDVAYLFKSEMPRACDLKELFAFSRPYSPLPRKIGNDDDTIVLDYEIDADYIYAAFMGQYGIDLLKVEMHWHVFLALLKGINESQKLSQIMSYRCYNKSNAEKEMSRQYEELEYAWRIEKEEDEDIEAFSRLFD